MITELTNLNKNSVIERYFQEASKDISYTKVWEEYRKYFLKEKNSYSLEDLEKEIRKKYPKFFGESKSYATSIT